jgi:uncharacterized protein
MAQHRRVSRISGAAAAILLSLATLGAQAVDAGRKALDLLLAARYSEFNALLSPEAKEKLTVDFLRDHAGAEIKSFGTLQEIGQPLTEKSGSFDLVSFPVRFSQMSLSVQITLNASGQVAGLHFRPADEPLPQVWNRPSYSKPERFTEREVTVGADPWKLGGTFTVPLGKGPFPAVVLVHGPGPNDRDEALYATRIFADIAEGLASRGIAVLRYDKRTRIYGSEMAGTAYTLREETIDDAVRAIALTRQEPEVNPNLVFVLGHSLGGYAVPRIARQDGKLAGAIVVAGNARHLEDIALAQTEFMLNAKGGATPEEQRRLDALKTEVAQVKSLTPNKDNPAKLVGLPTAYFLDLVGYDPPAEARRLGIPMLFLQGERDFQVSQEDFALWKKGLEGAKDVTFQTYPALNHLFIAGEGQPSPVEYRKGGNVSSVVIEEIASWVTSHKR